nr:reverse transcriptase domain-containing protein [Tanacetum cinerariifolium]
MDLEKLQPTADIVIFVGYAPSRKGYRIYNKRTRRIMEIIHVQLDELSEPMASLQLDKELEILFQLMFDEYLEPPRVKRLVSPANAVQVPIFSTDTPSSTTIDQDAPFPSHLLSSSELPPPILHQGVAAGSTIIEDNPFATTDNDPFVNIFSLEPSSKASLYGDFSSAESIHVKPKNFKSAVTEDCWFQAMQDEIHEFHWLQVWELVPRPDCLMIIALKVEAKALPTNDARVVCKFLKYLFAKFGTPRAIISDRGTHFCNDQFAKVMLKFGVTHRLATLYHPQTSGQMEVSNGGSKRIIEMIVGENRASWSDKLDDALWAF